MFDVETSLTKPLSGRVYVNLLEGVYICVYLFIYIYWKMLDPCFIHVGRVSNENSGFPWRIIKTNSCHIVADCRYIYIYPHYISLYIHILSYMCICVYIMFDVSKMISPSPSAGDGTWGLRDLEELKRPMQAMGRREIRPSSFGATSKSSSQELDCDHALNALWSDPSARN